MIEELRKANPHIAIHSVRDKEFDRFGIVYDGFDSSGLIDAALKGVEVPETGSKYLAVLECLDKHPDAVKVRSRIMGQTDAQIGICWGYNRFLNALEYHNSSEVCIAATPMVLLLADRRDIENDRLDSASIKAFLLEKGDTVELYATALHFCPCEAEGSFNCIVILPRGTNFPLDAGEELAPWLFAKNKWLIAHEKCKSLLDKGAHPGIYGENWQINPLENK